MARKYDTAWFVTKARQVHGDRYDYSASNYAKAKTGLVIGCPSHGLFTQQGWVHLRGSGCPKCAATSRGNTLKDRAGSFIQKAREVHGERFDYSRVQYVNCHTKVHLACMVCGSSFEQDPASHLRGTGCNACAVSSRVGLKKKKRTTTEFIAEATVLHGERYDYSATKYMGWEKGVTFCCKTCGILVSVTAAQHLHGQGCKKCAYREAGQEKAQTTASFIDSADAVHGSAYDYTAVRYVRSTLKVEISCKTCLRVFHQTPNTHLRGSGCPHCGIDKSARSRAMSMEDFIKAATTTHGSRFSYDKVAYKSSADTVVVVCNKCNRDLVITASSHLAGQGCYHCYKHYQISHAETLWLDSLNVPVRQHLIRLPSGKKTKVDGYAPATNTAYAFPGSFWHADPRSLDPEAEHPAIKRRNRDIHTDTLAQLHQMQWAGYRVCFIWELDWKAGRPAVLMPSASTSRQQSLFVCECAL